MSVIYGPVKFFKPAPEIENGFFEIQNDGKEFFMRWMKKCFELWFNQVFHNLSNWENCFKDGAYPSASFPSPNIPIAIATGIATLI